MIALSAARGAILEELVLHLLTMVGYRIVVAPEDGTRDGHSGLEVQGRGGLHQIDALAAFDRTPAFMYPLRLMVEAKCYSGHSRVGIEVARNAVGVLKDISENYFTVRPKKGGGAEIQVPRFNYHAAIFSTNGYSSGAQRYAIAHQVFLIQYAKVHVMQAVINGLLATQKRHFARSARDEQKGPTLKKLRAEARSMVSNGQAAFRDPDSALSEAGFAHVRDAVVAPLVQVKGSYFGMLQGRWPMHLLARDPLPAIAFATRDEVRCRVYGYGSDRWSFSPVDATEGEEGWFRLEFDIPEEVLELIAEVRGDRVAVAEIKQRHFSTLDLAGKIGGIYRQVRLRLDEPWIERYLGRARQT